MMLEPAIEMAATSGQTDEAQRREDAGGDRQRE